MHSKGISHNDIKPDNIIVSEKGHAVLADYGCARVNNAYKNAEEKLRIWSYRESSYYGPEVFQFLASKAEGDNFDEKKNDIFMLGQTLFLCIFRDFPRKHKIPDA